MLTRRAAGLLLHPTSLPGPYGVGDLGSCARQFIEWLAQAGFAWWQILPLPLPNGTQCPYVSPASLSGNTLLLDLAALVDSGLLRADELPSPLAPQTHVDFERALSIKLPLIALAAKRLATEQRAALDEFKAAQAWAEPAATFLALRETHGDGWWHWPAPLRDADAAAVREFAALPAARERIDELCAEQLMFERQWRALRDYARERGVGVIGDLPIYVDRDSHDVWAHRSLFQLDWHGTPIAVAGVPPDYFAELGQLWGNPLYDWDALAATDYAWWVARMKRTLEYADVVRIDHFRAFADYWRVPFEAKDARGGKWMPGPGEKFFAALHKALGSLPLIAEDLGDIDPAVHALRDALGLPGMRVLQFGFDADFHNLHHPRNITANTVCYTGTHDNDTTVGWWAQLDETTKHRVRVDLSTPGDDIAWDFMRTAFAAPSVLAVVPMQDVLRLGSDARMNHPGVVEGNWGWRLRDLDFDPQLAATLHALLVSAKRVS